jgi:signal transduction histidine kinase
MFLFHINLQKIKKPKAMLRMLQSLSDNDKFTLTGFDITKIKSVEKDKLEYINDPEEMMFMTSHKLRHPITQIIGLSDLLGDELSQEELTKVIGYSKASIASLDTFSRELTMFIHDLRRKIKMVEANKG